MAREQAGAKRWRTGGPDTRRACLRASYRVTASSKVLGAALRDVVVAMPGSSHRVEVRLAERVVPARLIVSSDIEHGLAAVQVSLRDARGPLGFYSTEAEGTQPIVWLPEGQVETTVSAPGMPPARSVFELRLDHEARPIPLRVHLRP